MRDWRTEGLENFGIFEPFLGAGRYDIPVIHPEYELPDLEWTGFNYARSLKGNENIGVHFFLDDYQFAGVWNKPQKYLGVLSRFGAVMAPDYSTYSDMPMILQIYNHYRKHWCAQLWQYHGITVIPTISWSTPESYEWCFDGEPQNSVVAVSTVGARRCMTAAELFKMGYDEMIRRLSPSAVLCYGKALPFMGEATEIQPFTAKFGKEN